MTDLSILLPDDEPQQVVRVVLGLHVLNFRQDVYGEAVRLASLLVTSVHVISAC